MLYVELRRVRRVLVWLASIVGAITALVLVALFSANRDAGPGWSVIQGSVRFSEILALAAFAPCVAAAFLSIGLSAEGSTLPILWTRPMARVQIAWRFFAVDLVGIIAAYAIAVAFGLIAMALTDTLHTLVFDVGSFAVGALVLACSLMYYGLVQAIAARLGRAPAVVGGLAVAMFVVGILAEVDFPPLLHAIVYGLDYLNPLAWLGNLGSENHGGPVTQGVGVIPLSIPWRALGAFCLALVALIAAVPLWSTREA